MKQGLYFLLGFSISLACAHVSPNTAATNDDYKKLYTQCRQIESQCEEQLREALDLLNNRIDCD